MRKILGLALLFALFVPAAHAEDAKKEIVAASPVETAGTVEDHAARLELSRQLHDIRQVKERVLASIDAVAQSLPVFEREDFKKYMELNVDFDALEEKSIQYVAEIYTVPELKAMIAYFGSNEGRSAEAKGEEYGSKFGAEVQKEIDKAIMAAKFDKVGERPHSGPTIEMLGR